MTAARVSVDRGLYLLALSDAIDSIEELVAGSDGADRAQALARLQRYHAEYKRLTGRAYDAIFSSVPSVPIHELPLNDSFRFPAQEGPR